MTIELAPAAAPLETEHRARASSPASSLGRDPPRERARRDPQLRAPAVRVRGDLLHRRLPRADEHPRAGPASRAHARHGRGPLALGLDPERCTLFVQSHRPEHTELAWLLATVTPVSWLERTPTYKEKKQSQPHDINHGLLTYPVLQAGDIVIYKASLVPVGKDQAAHLELSREIVRAFNSRYGDTFPEPEAVFTEAPVVLGTDGVRKMSKSVGNTIDVLADPDTIRKQIMSMVTDTKRILRTDPPPRGLQRLPAPPVLR